MNKYVKVIAVIALGLCLCLLGFYAGIRYSHCSTEPAVRSRFKYDDKTGSITFYTYYTDLNGSDVLHGTEYIIIGNIVSETYYEKGHMRGVHGYSLNK